MVSDSPYDYIMWYANADRVYTDLVHATIICLEYGTPVKYFPIDYRRDAFESIPFVGKDDDVFLRIDQAAFGKKKKFIENYVLNKLLVNCSLSFIL